MSPAPVGRREALLGFLRRFRVRRVIDGPAIFRYSLRIFIQPGVRKSELKVRHRFGGFRRCDFFEQRNGGGEVFAVKRILCLIE